MIVCDLCRDPAMHTLRVIFDEVDTERVLDLCEVHFDWFSRQAHPPVS